MAARHPNWIERHILSERMLENTEVHSPGFYECVAWICGTRKKNTFTFAGNVWVVTFIGFMVIAGLISDVIEDTAGYNILPQTAVQVAAWFFLTWLLLPLAVFVITLRRMARARLRRFFDAPFCYFCEYEIPGLVVSPEQAGALESTLRCSECGKVCQRIVATRQTDAV